MTKTCPQHGTPMVLLFTSWACDECDRIQREGPNGLAARREALVKKCMDTALLSQDSLNNGWWAMPIWRLTFTVFATEAGEKDFQWNLHVSRDRYPYPNDADLYLRQDAELWLRAHYSGLRA